MLIMFRKSVIMYQGPDISWSQLIMSLARNSPIGVLAQRGSMCLMRMFRYFSFVEAATSDLPPTIRST